MYPACANHEYHVQQCQACYSQQGPAYQIFSVEVGKYGEKNKKQDPKYTEDIGQQNPGLNLGVLFFIQSKREKFEYFLLR